MWCNWFQTELETFCSRENWSWYSWFSSKSKKYLLKKCQIPPFLRVFGEHILERLAQLARYVLNLDLLTNYVILNRNVALYIRHTVQKTAHPIYDTAFSMENKPYMTYFTLDLYKTYPHIKLNLLWNFDFVSCTVPLRPQN